MNKKVTIVAIIILVILCIIFCGMSLNDSNDTFYLIKLGESISKNGIDMLDHFSWIPNLPYTYPHWLYSLFIFFIYNNFGFTGVYLSTLLTFIALIVLLYYIIRKMCNNRVLALIASIISIIPLSLFAQPRAQLISIILILLEVFFINKIIITGKKRYIIYLAICSLIIANVHATVWIVFFVFFLPFLGEHFIYLYSKWKNKTFDFNGRLSLSKVNNVKLLVIAMIVCFLMGLLSPSRICYTYFLKISIGDSQKIIMEHSPLVLIKNPLIIFLCFLLFFSKSKIKVSEFFMICGITLMSLMSLRHILFFYTVGILYFSIILKRNLDEKKDLTFDVLERKFFKHIFIPLSVIIVLLGISYVKISHNVEKGFIDEKEYPIRAVKYIKDNLDYKNIKIINHYNQGSYLLFNDIKVFFDSRCDLYFKEFNNQNMNIFDDYFNYLSAEKEYNYDQLLQKYDGEFFLLNSQSEIYYMIKNDNRYTEVYADENFGLYQKKHS